MAEAISTARALAPEVLVAFGAVATLLIPALAAPRARPGIRRWLGWASAALVLVALGVELWQGATVVTLFSGGVVQDRFALFAKAAALLGLLAVVVTADWEVEAMPGALPLAFLAALGTMVAASANTLPAVWAGVALGVVAAAAAAGRRVRGQLAAEVETAAREGAARALLVTGALLMLLGVAAAYLMAIGSTADLATLQAGLSRAPAVTLPFALVSLLGLGALAGLLLLAPFRYGAGRSAATSPMGGGVAAGLGAAAAGVGLVKLAGALAPAGQGWAPGLAVVAAAAALVAGIGLVGRVHSGSWAGLLGLSQLAWVVAGVAAHDAQGLTAALLLLGTSVIALGGLAGLLGTADFAAAGGGDAAAFARSQPARAAGVALAGISLAGIPPLGGFFGQFAVATAVTANHLSWLLGLLLLAGLLAAYGAVRLVQAAFLEGPEEAAGRAPRRGRLAFQATAGATLVVILVLAYGLFANPISGLAFQGVEALGLR